MIMKKYVKPQLETEEFVAQEYVAACYIVNCNFPRNSSVWLETNGRQGLQTEAVKETQTFTTPQCGKTSWYHTHSEACYKKEVTVAEADQLLLDGYTWRGCNDKHIGVLKNPEFNGYYKSRGATNPSTCNLFVFEQGTSSGSHSNIHGSLLNDGDIATNPKAS